MRPQTKSALAAQNAALRERVAALERLLAATPGAGTPRPEGAEQDRALAERTRQIEGLRRRAEQLAILNQVARTLTTALDPQRVAEQILEAIQVLLPGGLARVWEHGPEEGVFRHMACVGMHDRPDPNLVRFPPGEGLMGLTLSTRRPVISPDVHQDPRFREKARAREEGVVSCIMVPLLAAERVCGLLAIFTRTPHDFSADEVDLLSSFAAQAAIAIENARLYAAAQRELVDRARAEEVLAQERNLLRTLIDTIPDRIHIKDAAGRYVIDNRAHRQSLRVAGLDEVVGRTSFDFYPPDLAGQLHRDDLAVVASGQPLVNRVERFADPATGQPEWDLTTKVPLCDSQGNRIGLVSISRNITERKQTEEVLAERTRELEGIRAISEEITRELDLQRLLQLMLQRAMELVGASTGVIRLWDAASQTLVPSTLQSMRLWPLRLGEGVSGVVAQRREGMIVNDFRSSPYATPRHLEQTTHAAVLAEPLLYRDQLVGVIAIGHCEGEGAFLPETARLLRLFAAPAAIAIENARLFDELKRAYENLQRAQEELIRSEKLRALGQMAAGMAHDLNNMLAAVLGQAELLRLRVSDPTVHDALGTLEVAATDGAQIVRRLQDFARQQPGRPLGAMDLASAVREALEITRARWKDEPQQRGIVIEVQAALEGLPPILGHAPEIREVLTNLIFNAVDAMPQGGRLSMTARKLDSSSRRSVESCRPTDDSTARPVDGSCEWVELCVADTGVGMTEEVRGRIFDPFFTTKGVKGTGLGLSVVYGILQRHRGQIEVSSAPGRGTTFRLHFQVASGAADVTERKSAPVRAVLPRRLLLIDDDPAVRRTLVDLLRSAGHAVTVAGGGAEGLAALRQGPVDLVLTDLGMPEMSGWEVARAVKAATPHLPVILLTGWGEHPASHSEHPGQVDRILGKPVRLQELLQVIQDLAAPPGDLPAA